MRPALRIPTLALAGLALLGLMACENKQETRANVLPVGDAVSDTGLPQDATGTGSACDCLQPDQWFRFDSLTLTSLDGGPHPVIKTLNGLWAVDIDHRELNFYFHVLSVTPTSVKFEVVNGARIEDPQPLCKCTTGGDKCDAPARTTDTCLLDAKASLDTTVPIEFPREGCHLKPSAKAGINVYAGTTTGTKNCAPNLPVKHAIPVRSAVLQAEMANDCQTIEDGLVLDGSFSEVALGQICTCVATSAQFTCPTCGVVDPKFVPDPKNGDDKACGGCNSKYQSLKSLLELFGDLNYTCKAEDGGKAVCLTAAFHGVRIEAPPPSCGKLK
jgi:hypothetical protein